MAMDVEATLAQSVICREAGVRYKSFRQLKASQLLRCDKH
jgi:hypothetical protein